MRIHSVCLASKSHKHEPVLFDLSEIIAPSVLAPLDPQVVAGGIAIKICHHCGVLYTERIEEKGAPLSTTKTTIRCSWPVTATEPSGTLGEECCPQDRCDKAGGHTDPHGGNFSPEELEKLPN